MAIPIQSKIEPPTIESIQAWLEQLREDQQEQNKEVKRCEDELMYARRNADRVVRDIKAAEAMLTALREAGHR
jgi:hypothetical protein